MLRLALIQMRVGADKLVNMKRASDLISSAVSEHSARLICLPECFNSPYGTSFFESYAEPVPDGPTCKAVSEIAREHGVWLVAGSIPERGDDGKLYNCSVTFDPRGTLVGLYRKLHLFDIEIPGQFSFKESSSLSSGKEPFYFELPLDDTDRQPKVIRVGIGICYDIRFPELSLLYANSHGCHVLLFPGAFNPKTGYQWIIPSTSRPTPFFQFCVVKCSYPPSAQSVATSSPC
ncbi:hypothetical protein CRM22_000110 [Opisthorchis felineus]|uniref:omega-amidase n=1 Tax=Opisthorchis felineus TaxID=147828 RepID=A0A4V6RH98_OPIFE|nr:hypothetical protein CRM22_000110 [Opisthorchis felineus]